MDENIVTKKLLEAAIFIHDYCRDYGCEDCPFLSQNQACHINDIPDTWYIPEVK